MNSRKKTKKGKLIRKGKRENMETEIMRRAKKGRRKTKRGSKGA